MAGAVISDLICGNQTALKYWEIIADNRSNGRRTAGLGLSRGSTKRPDFADVQPSRRSSLRCQTRVVTIEPEGKN
jgi:hypothetical protein